MVVLLYGSAALTVAGSFLPWLELNGLVTLFGVPANVPTHPFTFHELGVDVDAGRCTLGAGITVGLLAIVRTIRPGARWVRWFVAASALVISGAVGAWRRQGLSIAMGPGPFVALAGAALAIVAVALAGAWRDDRTGQVVIGASLGAGCVAVCGLLALVWPLGDPLHALFSQLPANFGAFKR